MLAMASNRLYGGLIAFSFLILGHLNVQALGGVDNVITRWNAVTQQMVRLLGMPSPVAHRTFALVHIAQYKALQQAYKKGVVHPEAAAAYAAHYVLSELFPFQQSQTFDGILSSHVSPLLLSDGEQKQLYNIGLDFAVDLLRARASDGSQNWVRFQPALAGSEAGLYQFTPNQTFALHPQLSSTTPLVIDSPAAFDNLGGPLGIPSSSYDASYLELGSVGNANSPLQSRFHRDTARFWDDVAWSSGVAGQLFNATLAICGPTLSVKETAQLFAKLATAGYDGFIAGWFQKYKYLFWRPITAFRQGDSTHPPDMSFTPLLSTPPHPEYPSTHSINAGLWGAVVTSFMGLSTSERTPNGPFVITSEAYPLPPRSYNTIEATMNEISASRVYAGVHFRKSAEDGLELGFGVGGYVYTHFEDIYGTL